MSAAAIRGMVRRLGPSSTMTDPPPDADLVAAFAARRDPDAFAALVSRHGPTVLGVCRRVLGNAHDSEDAFQAVFLVLARKVKTVRPAGAVGGWLFGVAVRTANKARVAMARRRRREMIAASNSTSRKRERPEDTRELRGAAAPHSTRNSASCPRRCARWWCCATCTARPARKRPGNSAARRGPSPRGCTVPASDSVRRWRGEGWRCRPQGSRRCSSRKRCRLRQLAPPSPPRSARPRLRS